MYSFLSVLVLHTSADYLKPCWLFLLDSHRCITLWGTWNVLYLVSWYTHTYICIYIAHILHYLLSTLSNFTLVLMHSSTFLLCLLAIIGIETWSGWALFVYSTSSWGWPDTPGLWCSTNKLFSKSTLAEHQVPIMPVYKARFFWPTLWSRGRPLHLALTISAVW